MTPLDQASAILKAAERIVNRDVPDALYADYGDLVMSEAPSLALALIEKHKENERLKEYLHAAATDYLGAAEKIKAAVPEIFPKTIAEYLESSEMCRRAASGEDIWSEYSSEMDNLRKHYSSALIEKHRALEAAEARLALLESVLAEAGEALDGLLMDRVPQGGWALAASVAAKIAKEKSDEA